MLHNDLLRERTSNEEILSIVQPPNINSARNNMELNNRFIYLWSPRKHACPIKTALTEEMY